MSISINRTAITLAMIWIVGVFLIACTAPPITPGPQPAELSGDEALESADSELPSPPPAGPEPGAQAEAPIEEPEARDLMFTLLGSDAAPAEQAILRIVDAGDRRFIPVLIELMRANQIGIVRGAGHEAHVRALESLSGQRFGFDWPAWVEWYGTTDIVPPPGFTGWKGQMLARIDPGFGEFLRDEFASTIRVEEIQWGGVVVDGIPALENPAMITAQAADYLVPWEPVFGIAINGEARAYPLRIMDWHEMANDVVGGVPVSLAYCTLCGAGIAYDGRASDGNTYSFGSSGFLFRSNKLMYDRQTRTLWNQLTGKPVLGPLVGNGENGESPQLSLLPVVLTSWNDWLEQHPDTLVLDIETGYARVYEIGAAYGGYFSSGETMFPVWERSDILDTKARIYALQLQGVPKAYPLDILAEERVVNDTLAETPLVLVTERGVVTVQGESLREGPAFYEAGGEVRAYMRGQETFVPGPAPDLLTDSSGRPWRVTEEALIGPEGESAPRVNGHLAYWFGWYAFFPNTLVYGVP